MSLNIDDLINEAKRSTTQPVVKDSECFDDFEKIAEVIDHHLENRDYLAEANAIAEQETNEFLEKYAAMRDKALQNGYTEQELVDWLEKNAGVGAWLRAGKSAKKATKVLKTQEKALLSKAHKMAEGSLAQQAKRHAALKPGQKFDGRKWYKHHYDRSLEQLRSQARKPHFKTSPSSKAGSKLKKGLALGGLGLAGAYGYNRLSNAANNVQPTQYEYGY